MFHPGSWQPRPPDLALNVTRPPMHCHRKHEQSLLAAIIEPRERAHSLRQWWDFCWLRFRVSTSCQHLRTSFWDFVSHHAQRCRERPCHAYELGQPRSEFVKYSIPHPAQNVVNKCNRQTCAGFSIVLYFTQYVSAYRNNCRSSCIVLCVQHSYLTLTVRLSDRYEWRVSAAYIK